MKENSIEEDITLIEKSLCDKDTIIQYHCWVGTDFLNAVERIVADHKRVLKENKDLKENCKKFIIRDELDEYVNNSVPVQKLKDKIEELKKNLHTVEHYETVGAIHVLQELLEKEKYYE